MKSRIHLVLTIACLLFNFGITAQNILTVDNNPGSTATYQTLSSAMSAAVDGDIIYIQPSATTYGSFSVNKELTIIGRSHSEPNKVSDVQTVSIFASNVTLKGLNTGVIGIGTTSETIENINVFECRAAAIRIGITPGFTTTMQANNVVIQGNLLPRIDISDATENILIANNIIAAGSSSHFLETAQAATTIVTNNIFYSIFTGNPVTFINTDTAPLVLSNNMFFRGTSSSTGTTNQVFEFDTGDFELNNNLTYKTGSGVIQFTTTNGGGIDENNTLANINPQFTNIDSSGSTSSFGGITYEPSTRLEDDLTLQAGSPALTGGTNGSEIGVYGGNFLYKQLGQPRGIPTVDIISNDVTVQQDGTLNITINAKSN